MNKQVHIHIHQRTGDTFNEADHPRASNGQFGSGGGSKSKSAPTTRAKHAGKVKPETPTGIGQNLALGPSEAAAAAKRLRAKKEEREGMIHTAKPEFSVGNNPSAQEAHKRILEKIQARAVKPEGGTPAPSGPSPQQIAKHAGKSTQDALDEAFGKFKAFTWKKVFPGTKSTMPAPGKDKKGAA